MIDLPKIKKDGLLVLIDSIFQYANVRVSELFSDIDSELMLFRNTSEFKKYYDSQINRNVKRLKFAIYFPQTESVYKISKEEVFSKYSGGQEYRYLISGIGIIQLILYINEDSTIECRLDVNSKPKLNEDTISSEYCNWDVLDKISDYIYKMIEYLKIN